MRLYENTSEAFVKYLLAHGYPAEAIALEWGYSKALVDVAILDEECNFPIAIYEIKGRKDRESIKRGIQQLKRTVHTLDITCPCSLVFASENNPYFEVVDVSEYVFSDDEPDVDAVMHRHTIHTPFSYQQLSIGTKSKVQAKQRKKRQRKIDTLKWKCLILIAVGIAFLVLDWKNCFELTTGRLVVLGGIALLVLIPSFGEVTIKDFSFKRKQEENKKP